MLRALRFCVLAGFCTCAAVGRADEYRWEISGAFAQRDADIIAESEQAFIGATRYFGTVDDGSRPLALAAFFDPEPRIAVTARREKTTSQDYGPGSVQVPDLVTETDEYTMSGRYVLPESKWYAGGSYTSEDPGTPPLGLDVVADSEAYGVLVGKYLGSNTTLELQLDRATRTTESTIQFCFVGLICGLGARIKTQQETDSASLQAMHVRESRRLTYALFGAVAATGGHVSFDRSAFTLPSPPFPPAVLPPGIVIGGTPGPPIIGGITTEFSLPRTRSYSAGAELFPTTKLGVRLGYTRFDDETPADDTYDVGVSWFFRRNVAIELTYSQQSADADVAFRHIDTGSVHVRGRF